MPYQIIKEIKIYCWTLTWMKNLILSKLNQWNSDSEIQSKLLKYVNQRCKYRFIFIIKSLLISSSIAQETNVILLISNGLNDARTSLINGKNI